MLEKIGIAAIVILVASESFAFSEAVLWALTAFMHLGKLAQEGTFVVAGLVAIGAGWWILQSALANRNL